MARTVRDASLETRTARIKLPIQHDPYWKAIDAGMHVGYRKGKRKASWLARYRRDIRKYRKCVLGLADDIQDADGAKVLSFSQAQEKARAWFTECTREDFGVEHVGPYTVGDAIRNYFAWYRAHRKSIRDVEYRANAFILPALGEVEVSRLTALKLRQWHEAMVTNPPRMRTRQGEPQQYRKTSDDPDYTRRRQTSANKVLTILKAALNQAWHDGKVSNDEAWRRVKPFRDADKAKVRYLGADECRRLVNACDADFRGLVQAALLTGCRYGELTAMQVGDFTRESESVHVRTSKSGKPRHVPLNAEGNTFFTRLVTGRASADRMFVRADGKPWGVSHQRRRLESAAKRASIEDVTFHILRHCYGSALAMNGIPMGVIAAALGHSDTRITEKHYAALAPSYVGYMIRAHLPNLGMVQEDKNVVSLRLND